MSAIEGLHLLYLIINLSYNRLLLIILRVTHLTGSTENTEDNA